jgi:hypothetical protein
MRWQRAQGAVPVDWISGVMIDYARANPSTLAAIVTLGMRAFTLGRNTARQSVTVDVGSNFPAVSRRHAVIVAAGPDRYQIIDLDSTNGPEVWENGRWKSVTQAVISSGQAFRLGRQFETSVAALARLGYKVPQFTEAGGKRAPLFSDWQNGALVCASMVLGIVGGGIGLTAGFSDYALVGVLGAIFGHDAATEFRQFVMIASPVCSIVGGAIVLNNPGIGGMLMAANAAALPLLFGLDNFPMLPVLLSGLGAAAAFLSMRDAIAEWIR